MYSRVLTSLLFVTMTPLASAQTLLFNASFTDEEIRGEPKIVRIERQDHVVESDRDRANATPYLQETTNISQGVEKLNAGFTCQMAH